MRMCVRAHMCVAMGGGGGGGRVRGWDGWEWGGVTEIDGPGVTVSELDGFDSNRAPRVLQNSQAITSVTERPQKRGKHTLAVKHCKALHCEAWCTGLNLSEPLLNPSG